VWDALSVEIKREYARTTLPRVGQGYSGLDRLAGLDLNINVLRSQNVVMQPADCSTSLHGRQPAVLPCTPFLVRL